MKRATLEMIAITSAIAKDAVPAPPTNPVLDDCETLTLDGSLKVILGPRPKVKGIRSGRSKRGSALMQAALLRQKRLEALMPDHLVLPFAPGTGVVDDFNLFARANRDEIAKGLDGSRGKRQFQTVVSWDTEAAPFHFGQTPSELESLRDRFRSAILDRLASIASDVIALPCPEDTIANAVLLMELDANAALDAALEDVDRLWTEGLKIRVLGPAPAVSFFRGQIERIEPGDFLDAAALLRLPTDQVPSDAEVSSARKTALRQLGAQSDVTPEAIRRAATTLRMCARLGVCPMTCRPTPLLSWHRDGPSFSGGSAIPLEEVA